MAGYCGLMAAGVWVNTGFLSQIKGVLDALVMSSDLPGFIRFTTKVLADPNSANLLLHPPLHFDWFLNR